MKKSVYISNNAALKSTQQWITAAYVWKLLYFPFSWFISSDIMPIESLKPIFFHTVGDGKYIPLFGNIIFLALIIIAFVRLHSHTNQVLRKASKLFILAYILKIMLEQTNAGFVAGTYLYDATGSLCLFFLMFFTAVALGYSPLIMASAYLGKSPALAYHHSHFLYLNIIIISSALITVSYYTMQYANNLLPLQGWETPFILLFSILYPPIYAAYIICWRKVVRTPSIIPAFERIMRFQSVSPLETEVYFLITLFGYTVLIFISALLLYYYY